MYPKQKKLYKFYETQRTEKNQKNNVSTRENCDKTHVVQTNRIIIARRDDHKLYMGTNKTTSTTSTYKTKYQQILAKPPIQQTNKRNYTNRETTKEKPAKETHASEGKRERR